GPERLFTIGSEKDVLARLEDESRAKDPSQPFLTPGPLDRFDVVDSPTLGQMWFQNRLTGEAVDFERKGTMSIANQQAVHPAGSPPEAAVSGETLGIADM